MKKQLLIAATAALLSLPLALNAADQSKKKGNPFAAADTDGDGNVTFVEYKAAMKGKMDDAAAKKRFDALDKNKDGKLTSEEFSAGGGKKGGGKKKNA